LISTQRRKDAKEKLPGRLFTTDFSDHTDGKSVDHYPCYSRSVVENQRGPNLLNHS
jgi:hypothetical protein